LIWIESLNTLNPDLGVTKGLFPSKKKAILNEHSMIDAGKFSIGSPALLKLPFSIKD
jgi:hypothetical protein